MNKSVNLICNRLQKAGHQAFVVGGCVRDMLRDVQPKDFDITTDASPDEVKKIFADFPVTGVGEAFGIVVVVINNEPFEIAQFRQDIGGNGRHPEAVKAVTDIKFDLERRDFRMNAIALDPMADNFVDPFNGMNDIFNQVICFVGNPSDRIDEDHLRILRAFRFMSQLSFSIEENSLNAIKNAINAGNVLSGLSQERITAEFSKIVAGKNSFNTIKLMLETGIFEQIIPEFAELRMSHNNRFHSEIMEPFGNSILAHVMFVFQYFNEMRDTFKFNNAANLVLGLAALFHDIGKPMCKEVKPDGTFRYHHHDIEGAKLTKVILTRMKFSNDIIDQVVALVAGHMNLHDGPKMKKTSSIRKLLGRDDIQLLSALGICDTLGTAGSDGVPNHQEVEVLTKFIEENMNKFPEMLPSPIVTGLDLISAGQKPGPLFKRALEIAYNCQLNGTSEKRYLVNQAMSFIKTEQAK